MKGNYSRSINYTTQLITGNPHLNKLVNMLIVYTCFQYQTNYEFRHTVYYSIAA